MRARGGSYLRDTTVIRYLVLGFHSQQICYAIEVGKLIYLAKTAMCCPSTNNVIA